MTSYDVSVLTPSFGYGRYIAHAIESVFAQGDLTVEQVVQDAGSQDETLDVLSNLVHRYGDALSWESKPDRGQSDALNVALQRASGRWVAWLNADEIYLPDGLTKLVDEGDRTGADVVFGDALFLDDNLRLLRLKAQHPFSLDVLTKYGTFIATCSTVIRRSALWERPWDVALRLLMDRDLFLRLHQRGARFSYLPWPAGAFRVHDSRVSAGTPSDFASDYSMVAERYGSVGHIGRLYGRALHAGLKGISKGYLREVKARRFRGADMSWLSGAGDSVAFEDLVRRCYGRPRASSSAIARRSRPPRA